MAETFSESVSILLQNVGSNFALCVDMPRKLLERSDRLPYHVTARTNNRENFHLDLPRFWMVVESELRAMNLIFGLEVHALVLMPNHFHMIVTAPEQDLGIIMNNFMSNVTRRSNRIVGRSGHTFGGPYHWSIIKSSRYFGHALKYVYRNPVKAKLCEKVEEYPFSTLSGLIGETHLPFPIHFTRALLEVGLPLDDYSHLLDWLNRPFPQKAENLIKVGLKRRTFDNVISRETRRADSLAELL